MKKRKVLVVLGGNSKERSVSLDSGKACAKSIDKKKIGILQKIIITLKMMAVSSILKG